MSSEAQIEANRENAQHSTGPKTNEGKSVSSQNAHRHGLAAGIFTVLPWERQSEYDELVDSLLYQHDPQTPFEELLVEKMAQHFWLAQRAVHFQDLCFDRENPMSLEDPGFKLYMRYQATHERAYHKLSDELRKLRNQTQKEQIGFVSQLAKKAAELRRQAADKRKENEEIRRTAAETRREANELRRSELHSKRLAVLDAQIARLATSAPAPRPAESAVAPQTEAENAVEKRLKAA